MRSRRCSLVLLLAAAVAAPACHLPAWQGEMPPVVPLADRCGSGALTPAGQAALQRRPYLQDARRRGVTVAWASAPVSAPRVVVAARDDAARAPIAEVAARRDEADTIVARVDGLEEGGAYCYRVVTDRGPLTEWATLTLAPPPDPERVDRFVVLGDTGTGSRAQHAIARRLTSVPADAILFLGDIAYGSGTRTQLETRFFDVYAELFQRLPVYSAVGNHDRRTARGRPFDEMFVLPGNERWYSMDLGDVHFVVLDTMQIGPAQAAWLEADLAATRQQFIVVLAHHPPYTAAWRGPSRQFRRTFLPILQRHGVELVLSGHEHHYERSHVVAGIVYVVSGGGGAPLTRVGRGGHTRVARAVHHYLTLEAHRDRLVVRAVDIDGRAFDEVVLPDRRARTAETTPPRRSVSSTAQP